MKKGLFSVVGLMVFAGAHAGITYSGITANVAFTPSGSTTLTALQSGANNQELDFVPGSLPVIVNSTTGPTGAIVTISYNASSTYAVGSISQVILGSIFGPASITYTGDVTTNSGGTTLATFGGTTLNAPVPITFSSSATNYQVSETITLDPTPGPSYAALNDVEQNALAVPEPYSFAVLGLGVLGLVRRRARR